jgi:hypothetical protein
MSGLGPSPRAASMRARDDASAKEIAHSTLLDWRLECGFPVSSADGLTGPIRRARRVNFFNTVCGWLG